MAGRYTGRGIPFDDLRQVAFLGLVKAAHRFDGTRGSDFRSFAVPTIRGEIRRHFRDAGWTIRPPRRIQELQPKIWAAEAELTQQLHRSPTAAELAEHLGVEEQEIVESLTADGCFQPTSLDTPAPEREDGSLSERLGDEDEGYEDVEARLMVNHAVRSLEPRDRKIVQLRFYEGLTQQQIGSEIGVTQMQVSRLLSRILDQLRDALNRSIWESAGEDLPKSA